MRRNAASPAGWGIPTQLFRQKANSEKVFGPEGLSTVAEGGSATS
jgi:hypothetical protein